MLSVCLNHSNISIQDMENLDTEKLMTIQVEQLEKEKKDLNERLRITAKRVDHLERAYRKDERPLLAKDYEDQKENDRQTFNTIQQARLQASIVTHEQDLEAKKRLSCMMGDYLARKNVILAERQKEFARKKEAAQKKIDEEKAKRTKAILREREEKRKLEEEEEARKRQEYEEEQARLEAGMCSLSIAHVVCRHKSIALERAEEEERQRALEEAAAEAKRLEEEKAEKAAALRRQREKERADDAEKARLQREREEEAEARARARAAEKAAERARPLVPATSGRGEGRRS